MKTSEHKRYLVTVNATAPVLLSSSIFAESEEAAKSIFQLRLRNWANCQPRFLPHVELTDRLLPDSDYVEAEIAVEDFPVGEDEEVTHADER